MAGLAIAGLAMAGFNAVTISGFAIAGLAMAGFAIAGLAMAGLAIAALAMAGLAMAGFDGLMIPGAVGSGLSVVVACKPPATKVPPGAVISCTFTVMLAVGLADCANTGRDTASCAGTATSSVVTTGPNCTSEAKPAGSTVPLASNG